MLQLDAQPDHAVSLCYPTIGQGVLHRLVLPILAIVSLLWCLLFFVSSSVLMPANDFGRILYATRAALDGRGMYAWTRATPVRLETGYSLDLYDMNPPHLHALFLPFTLLNDDHALIVWWVLSGLCFFFVVRWTLAEIQFDLTLEQRSWAAVILLAFSGTTAILATAQVSFVLLVPITLMWLAARRGLWGWSGALLGLALSVKPFLAVFLPYFLWRRHYRALAMCLATTFLCFALGILVFGWDSHLSWRHRLAESTGWAWLPMNASLTGFLTRTFAFSIWYISFAELSSGTVWWTWLTIGGALGLLTLAVTRGGRSPQEVDRDITLLLTSAVLLCPLGWIYYLWLLLPSLAGMCKAGWDERSRISRSWTACFLLTVVGLSIFWPIIFTRIFQPETIAARLALPAGRFYPEAIATFFLGNIYFWGLLAFWIYLVRDALARRKEPLPAVERRLPPLDRADFRVSIVMPVFSETTSVRSVSGWLLENLGPEVEEIILVQSPRSSAESQMVCRQLQQKFPQVRLLVQQNNPGLGHAVREGFAAARGNLVLCMDSDGEMENETVLRMLDEMARGGHGLVAGSRWLPGGGFTGYSTLKFYLNWCFQQVFRVVFWTRLTDLTYGFKLLRAELVHGIAWTGTLHEIACETTLKPVRLGIPVAEVPTRWTARTQGVSKNTFWRNFRYVHMGLSILLQGAVSNDAARTGPMKRASGSACSLPGTLAARRTLVEA